MEILLVAVVTFLLCFLLDKGFTKLFRSAPQHRSGQSVRLNQYLGIAGLLLAVLGVAAMLTGGKLLLLGGGILVLVGIFLMVYYMSFGVFYDADSFLVMSFGRKRRTYRYDQIQSQQLYINGNSILLELYLTDGTSMQLQSTMPGWGNFMDAAFAGWCRQKGRMPEECSFHDPDNSCWFPPVEG